MRSVDCKFIDRLNALFTRCVYVSPHLGQAVGALAVAISYRDAKRSERKRSWSGPFVVAIAAIGGLLWFAPQSTSAVQHFLATVLAFPVR
jgi:hypothetical protein